MKKPALGTVLVALLAGVALGTALLAYQHIQFTRRLNRARIQIGYLEARQNAYRMLAAEVLEYSKRDPAIDPILQAYGLKPRPAQAPARPGGR